MDNVTIRSKVYQFIREYFYKNDFLEVETPYLCQSPGMEPHIGPFETTYRPEMNPGKEQTLYLPSSPEYAMKRLLCRGYQNIFQICKSFRNGEHSDMHNPEFTILEWYMAGTDYTQMMDDTEGLIKYVHAGLLSPNTHFNTSSPWQRMTVREAMIQHARIDIEKETLTDEDFYKEFVSNVEPHLGKDAPTFIFDYPVSQASLARKKKSDPRYAERFELYINGVELCNGFSELTDAAEQEARFLEEQKQKAANYGKTFPIDHSFLDALKNGMPESSGNALGVDRLIMLLTGLKTIQDVLSFPFGTN